MQCILFIFLYFFSFLYQKYKYDFLEKLRHIQLKTYIYFLKETFFFKFVYLISKEHLTYKSTIPNIKYKRVKKMI
jgi:hypothetical protein